MYRDRHSPPSSPSQRRSWLIWSKVCNNKGARLLQRPFQAGVISLAPKPRTQNPFIANVGGRVAEVDERLAQTRSPVVPKPASPSGLTRSANAIFQPPQHSLQLFVRSAKAHRDTESRTTESIDGRLRAKPPSETSCSTSPPYQAFVLLPLRTESRLPP